MKYILTISMMSFFLSCSENRNTEDRPIQSNIQLKQDNVDVENFTSFFSKFSSDSIFQVSRITFPIVIESYDIDSDSFEHSKMDQMEWGFFNIKDLGEDYFVTIKKSDSNTLLNLQKNDTGIYVDYIFVLRNNKWIMVKIIDQST